MPTDILSLRCWAGLHLAWRAALQQRPCLLWGVNIGAGLAFVGAGLSLLLRQQRGTA